MCKNTESLKRTRKNQTSENVVRATYYSAFFLVWKRRTDGRTKYPHKRPSFGKMRKISKKFGKNRKKANKMGKKRKFSSNFFLLTKWFFTWLTINILRLELIKGKPIEKLGYGALRKILSFSLYHSPWVNFFKNNFKHNEHHSRDALFHPKHNNLIHNFDQIIKKLRKRHRKGTKISTSIQLTKKKSQLASSITKRV